VLYRSYPTPSVALPIWLRAAWVGYTRQGDVGALARAITEGCQPGVLTERRPAAQRRSAEYGIAATAHGIETAVAAVLGR
jgi:hypothetical protein